MGVGGSLPDTPDMRVQGLEMKNCRHIDFNAGDLQIDRRPVSDEEIEASKTAKGAWTKKSLVKFGVPWPPPYGWLEALKKHGVPLFPETYVTAAWDRKKKRRAAKRAAKKKAVMVAPKRERRAEFYKSWEWRTLRMQVLKQFGPVCMCCGAQRGDTNIAGEPVRICVDHIKPLATHWELRLEKDNLQVLCDECNQGKGAWDETDWRVNAAIEAQLRYTV